jgi:hypothetical protein
MAATIDSRKLNVFERNLLHLETTVNFQFSVMLRVRGSLPAAALEEALSAESRSHYYLNVRLSGDGERFERRDDLRIPVAVVKGREDGDWAAMVERELGEGFDMRRGPLARVTLIQREGLSDVIACFQHIAADAASAFRFLDAAIARCAAVARGETPGPPPAREAKVPDASYFPAATRGFSGALKRLGFVARYAHSMLRFPKARYPRYDRVPYGARSLRLVPRELDAATTAALVDASRRHGASVQGALCAAALIALAEEIKTRAGVPKPALECVSSVNLRRLLDPRPSDEDMGLWVGRVSTAFPMEAARALWPLARGVKRDLERQLARHDMFSGFLVLFSKVHSDPEAFTKTFESPKPHVGVTNVGVLELPAREGPYEVLDARFASSLRFTQGGPWGVIVAATTFGGALAADFHFLREYWDAGDAAALADRAIAKLRDGASR